MLLNSEQGDTINETAKSLKRCKPNFEGMIATAREKLKKATCLKDALLAYVGGRRQDERLYTIIGELVCEEIQLEKAIEQTIAEQENYKE